MTRQLFDAATTGNISAFRAALALGDINSVNELGDTPLMASCRLGHAELVKVMLSKGADVSLKNKDGLRAMDLAEQFGRMEIVGLLRNAGAVGGNRADSPATRSGSLANSIEALFSGFIPCFNRLDEMYQSLFLSDLATVIFFLRKGEGLSTYDGIGLTMATMFLGAPAQYIELAGKIHQASPEEIVELERSLQDVAAAHSSGQPTPAGQPTLLSLEGFKSDDVDKGRKILYDFAELMTKADGTVTTLKVESLRNLSRELMATKAVSPHSSGRNTEPSVSLEAAMASLNGLVGMESVKKDVQSLINVLRVNQLRKREGLPEQKISMHSVFLGPPGTGKTTVARILADVYAALGILGKNSFIETDRSGMVAGYVGQTAIKTDDVISQAIDGVLFIDEAYALARGDGDFGQEAIDTLLKRMEDHRARLAVVVAGYQDEMKKFIDSNPGLKSRFNRFFYFDDYIPEQLVEIFKKLSFDAGFALTDGATDRVIELFQTLYSKRDRRFGNARLVRNVFEKAFEKHANRTAGIAPITREILSTLLDEDIPYDEFV